jgi:hypothetical protein
VEQKPKILELALVALIQSKSLATSKTFWWGNLKRLFKD